MTIMLYELAGANPALRFSPYCWRVRLALAHKDLPVETVAWHFTEPKKLEFSGQGKVPVLVDGAKIVADSWAIAGYLDDAYPDHPPLFPMGTTHVRFLNAWADGVMNPAIARVIVTDVHAALRPKDQAYYRTSREARFGRTLEQFTAGRSSNVAALRVLLEPVRSVLASQPWLGGDQPDYADYIVAGSLMWPFCLSVFDWLEANDPVAVWFAEVRALFGGLGDNAKTV